MVTGFAPRALSNSLLFQGYAHWGDFATNPTLKDAIRKLVMNMEAVGNNTATQETKDFIRRYYLSSSYRDNVEDPNDNPRGNVLVPSVTHKLRMYSTLFGIARP